MLWGGYPLAINTLWGGLDVALGGLRRQTTTPADHPARPWLAGGDGFRPPDHHMLVYQALL